LARLDKLVEKQPFQAAVRRFRRQWRKSWHVWNETAWLTKLDPAFEKALAEEGLSEDGLEWPEY
jgi:hypothetical protein